MRLCGQLIALCLVSLLPIYCYAEQILIKDGASFKGWQISAKQFKTCFNNIIDIGNGIIKVADEECEKEGPYAPQAPPAPVKEELCMTLHIEYDTDKSIILPAAYGEVEKVANFMKRYPQVNGTIEGHTDNIESAKYNLKLSQKRADGVVKTLVEKYGIDKSRLTEKGYGLTRPVADNMTKEGRQKNRRTVANFGCVTMERESKGQSSKPQIENNKTEDPTGLRPAR